MNRVSEKNEALISEDGTAGKMPGECLTASLINIWYSFNKRSGDHLDESEKAKYVGLDCEMVGIGFNGKQSALARCANFSIHFNLIDAPFVLYRCCLVDFDGEKIYDRFVRPKSFVTDFRTKYSGVRRCDLRKGEAVTLEEVHISLMLDARSPHLYLTAVYCSVCCRWPP
jgi:hypothetical protein